MCGGGLSVRSLHGPRQLRARLHPAGARRRPARDDAAADATGGRFPRAGGGFSPPRAALEDRRAAPRRLHREAVPAPPAARRDAALEAGNARAAKFAVLREVSRWGRSRSPRSGAAALGKLRRRPRPIGGAMGSSSAWARRHPLLDCDTSRREAKPQHRRTRPIRGAAGRRRRPLGHARAMCSRFVRAPKGQPAVNTTTLPGGTRPVARNGSRKKDSASAAALVDGRAATAATPQVNES